MSCKSGSRHEDDCCCSKKAEDKPPRRHHQQHHSFAQQYPKKKLLTWAVETFYDNCAAFNLRYVPYRITYDRSECLHNAAKDVFMLLCFMAANFVVLLTILAKLAIHLGFVFWDTMNWLLHRSHDHKCHLQKRLKSLIASETQASERGLKAMNCSETQAAEKRLKSFICHGSKTPVPDENVNRPSPEDDNDINKSLPV